MYSMHLIHAAVDAFKLAFRLLLGKASDNLYIAGLAGGSYNQKSFVKVI